MSFCWLINKRFIFVFKISIKGGQRLVNIFANICIIKNNSNQKNQLANTIAININILNCKLKDVRIHIIILICAEINKLNDFCRVVIAVFQVNIS